MPRLLSHGDKVDLAGRVEVDEAGESCIHGAVCLRAARSNKLLVVYDTGSMPLQCYQMRTGVILSALAYGMPCPTVVELRSNGDLPPGIRESDYDGCVVVAPSGVSSGACKLFLTKPRSTWPYMLVMTWYAKDARTTGGPATGMGTVLPPVVESSLLSIDTLSRGIVRMYYRTYTHHLWDGTTPITRVVYSGDKNYVWITNPVPDNTGNTLALWSTLGTVNIWNSQPLELALYAKRMGWQLAPITILPIIDDPKQYVAPYMRHCLRQLAQTLRAHGGRLIVAWNPQDVGYGAIGNDGVNPDLLAAYQENPDVFSFVLHDHNGLRGDLGLTFLQELSGRTPDEVRIYLNEQLAISRAQLGGVPVALHYCGAFLNAENKISVDGLRIAYEMGCSRVRGLCRLRVSSGNYVDIYAGFARSGDVCMLVYPSVPGCGSSGALDGQNGWLFRGSETKYVTESMYYASCVENLLYGIMRCRVGEISTWGHGVNVVASRQGFIALQSQPSEGDTVTISSGDTLRTYQFTADDSSVSSAIPVRIGLNLSETTANLISAIAANQPDAVVYPKPVASNDGYTMVLLTNYSQGAPISVSTTVLGALTEPISERNVLLDYLTHSVLALVQATEDQITVLK